MICLMRNSIRFLLALFVGTRTVCHLILRWFLKNCAIWLHPFDLGVFEYSFSDLTLLVFFKAMINCHFLSAVKYISPKVYWFLIFLILLHIWHKFYFVLSNSLGLPAIQNNCWYIVNDSRSQRGYAAGRSLLPLFIIFRLLKGLYLQKHWLLSISEIYCKFRATFKINHLNS